MAAIRQDISTVREEEARMPILIQLIEGDGEERVQRIALTSSTIREVRHRGAGIEARHLIGIARVGDRGRPREVAGTDVLRSQRELNPLGTHLSDIPIQLIDEAASTLRQYLVDEVTTLTIEEGDTCRDTLIEETEVEAPVELIHLLIGQVIVSRLININPRLNEVSIPEEGKEGLQTRQCIVHIRDRPRHPVGEAHRERREGLELGEEGFLIDSPVTTNVPSGDVADRASTTELVRPFTAVRSIHTVATEESIVDITDQRDPAVERRMNVVVLLALIT